MTSIRLAGAQIPVTQDIQYNKKQIFKALDWAKDNQVDHLVTPEGSLSGYGSFTLFDESVELSDALKEVEEHQKIVVAIQKLLDVQTTCPKHLLNLTSKHKFVHSK